MAVVSVKFFCKNEPSGASILSQWTTGLVGSYTCKVKLADVERPEIEMIPGTALTNVDPERWTHAVYADGRVYRITGIRQGPVVTVPESQSGSPAKRIGSVVFTLELDMLATAHYVSRYMVTTPKDYSLTARWSRYPTPSGPLEQFQIRPAQMMRTLNRAALPKISSTIVTTTDALPIVFVKISAVINGETTHLSCYCAVTNDDNKYVSNYLSITNNANYCYPSLYAIMNYLPTVLGIPSDDIIDVSVTECSPFDFEFEGTMGYNGRDNIYVDHALTSFLCSFTVSGNTYHVAFEQLEAMIFDPQPYTVTIQLTDKERTLGQVVLNDANNSACATIDTRYAVYNSVSQKWEIKVTYRCKIEIGGMFSEIRMADGSLLRFPEGHLPYVGTAWGDYVAGQRAYDREIAMIEKEKAQVDMIAGVTSSLANGAFTAAFSGGAGAATAAFGAVGTIGSWYEGERARENELNAKDGLMHTAPSTMYSPEYGVTYLNNIIGFESMRMFIVNMPDGVSDGDLTYYVQRRGYPVTDWYNQLKYSNLPTEGFLQGELADCDLSVFTGLGEFRRILERQLANGIHFKVTT